MSHKLFHGDCLDLLNQLKRVPLMFIDPPDNLGLKYAGYTDKIPKEQYYNWIETVIRRAIPVADCFWISYYWAHDLEIKYIVRNILKRTHPTVKARNIIWRYTFGQYTETDYASGFRYLLRLTKPSAIWNPDSIRVPSARMLLGDKRAAGPRVPDDYWCMSDGVWNIPRVTGNSTERCNWHPTQHPEKLMHRIISAHSNPGDTVVDLCGGTGTTIRVCEDLKRNALVSEISGTYVSKLLEENSNLELVKR